MKAPTQKRYSMAQKVGSPELTPQNRALFGDCAAVLISSGDLETRGVKEDVSAQQTEQSIFLTSSVESAAVQVISEDRTDVAAANKE